MPNSNAIPANGGNTYSDQWSAPYWSILPYAPWDTGGVLPWSPAPTTGSITLTEPRKIRLKLSEVERLREAARGDDALKAVLQKFARHIEIDVDFA